MPPNPTAAYKSSSFEKLYFSFTFLIFSEVNTSSTLKPCSLISASIINLPFSMFADLSCFLKKLRILLLALEERTIFNQSLLGPYECRSEEHTSELQSHFDIVSRLLL